MSFIKLTRVKILRDWAGKRFTERIGEIYIKREDIKNVFRYKRTEYLKDEYTEIVMEDGIGYIVDEPVDKIIEQII